MPKVAVLLLRIDGFEDLPTRDYADRLFTGAGNGTGNLVDYYRDMSHGRLDLSGTTVMGWMDYLHTVDDLTKAADTAKADKKKELLATGKSEADAEKEAGIHAWRTRRATIKTWGLDAAKAAGYDLSGFDTFVHVFNTSVDYFGSPGSCVVNWFPGDNNHGAFSIDLTGVAHEVGHALGLAAHSRREDSLDDYTDPWDVMSVYDGVYLDAGGTLTPPTSPYYTFGPGLNAVNMEIAGWLDATRLYSTGSTNATFRLRPLHRRDLPGYLAAKVQFGLETLYVEFRTDDRWDAAIPRPCVLLHSKAVHPSSGLPCSELVVARPDAVSPETWLGEGHTYQVGDPADPFGFVAKLTVTSIDSAQQEATIVLAIRHKRPIEPQGVPFGGVTSDGGGLVFVPGRGFVRVPPRSPLLRILEHVAEIETLTSLQVEGHTRQLQEIALDHLVRARDDLSAVIDSRSDPQVPAPRMLSADVMTAAEPQLES